MVAEVENHVHPVKMIGGFVIDYFRWTQLTPMVLLWAIVVGGLLLTAFVNYEDEIWDTSERVVLWAADLPGVGPKVTAWIEEQEAKQAAEEAARARAAEAADSTDRVGGSEAPETVADPNASHDGEEAFDQLLGFVMKVWAVVSLVFMAFAWLFNLLFGPFEPWPLKRKLRLLALICLMFPVGFLIFEFAAPDRFHGSPLGHGFLFAAFYFIVSAWCLSISHLLRWAHTLLMNADIGGPKKQEGLL